MESDLLPFVGRSPELAALGRLLQAAEPRLIAITGPAGAGKTRLVQQAAALYADLFDELCFISVNTENSPWLSFPAAAWRGLLVLDGLDGAPDYRTNWPEMLSQLPAARILVTARALPPVSGLLRLRLDGLPVPPEEQQTQLACYASVKLMVAVLGQKRPGFDPTGAELRQIAAVCRKAGGLPGEIIHAAAAFARQQMA